MNLQEQHFIVQTQLDGLLNTHKDRVAQTTSTDAGSSVQIGKLLSMQDVVNAVLFPMREQSVQYLHIINANMKYRKWYKNTLQTLSFMQSASQAAASSIDSSNDSIVRDGSGFKIKLTRDTLNKDDVYLMLVIDNMSEQQKERGVFLHTESNETFLVLHLENANNNQWQKLINANSEYYLSLLDTDSHVYLT